MSGVIPWEEPDNENIINEKEMKDLGESKVWKEIYTKSGILKTVASTQIGQQIVLDESLRVLPMIREWIENGSANVYKLDLIDYFQTDDIILTKLAEVYFFLAGGIYKSVYTNGKAETDVRQIIRHKKINSIKLRILPDLDFNLVWRFVEIAVDYSNYFQIESELIIVNDKFKTIFDYTCTISEKIIDKLALDSRLAFYPTPMLIPPINWEIVDGKIKGGYEGYGDFQYELVRTGTFKINYNNFGPKIYESVNYIQQVPWRVSNEMLDVVKTDLKFPKKDDFIKLEFPDSDSCLLGIDIEIIEETLNEELFEGVVNDRKLYNSEIELYNAEALDLESAIGKYRAVKMAVDIAERYTNIDIWFPHNYDFRGRVYPIAIGLSPQGSDAVKSMIEYRDGEELNKEGLKWAWAYLASLFGDDKLDFEDRIIRGKELLYTHYLEADEPYQFLAHQLEMHRQFDEDGYLFKGRVHLDACNSGSQFTSAITGDIKGCLATNILPTYLRLPTPEDKEGKIIGQERQDAYMLVAEKALAESILRVSNEPDSELLDVYKMFIDILTSDGRKICKTPVMVSNYGGTEMGRANILWDMFRELGVDKNLITKKNSSIFAKLIGNSIQGVLTGGKEFEIYIHKMNNVLASMNKAITWMMYDGFHVTHVKQKELKIRKITCWLPNSRRKTILNKKSYSRDKVSSMKMKSAISPNYIHSLDAELLRMVALRMKEVGIINSDWIHDSFGCHPNNVTQMLHITKDEFRKMVRRNPLTILDIQLRKQVPPHNAKMNSAINKIKKPIIDYFDGSRGTLDDVMNSDWFFS